MPLRERMTFTQRTVSRALLVLLTAGGVLLSIYVAREESQQHRTLERLRIGEVVDAHFGAVSEHLLERANLAKTVSRFFMPPPLAAPAPLGTFGIRALGLAPDLATVGWLPEVERRRCRTGAGIAAGRRCPESDLAQRRTDSRSIR